MNIRDVKQSDLEFFFKHQQDKDSQYMAAFIAEDPSDRNQFDTHWNKIMNNKNIIIQTIIYENKVVGHLAKFVYENQNEITYWIDREFWGKGIATQALSLFLNQLSPPIYARVSTDNIGSLKVLQKNNFKIISEDKGYANARKMEIKEYVLIYE